MNIGDLLSDEIILQELGQRLARQRVTQGFTQADLAEQAGVSKRTVERVEAGESTQISTLIRIFRILGLLNTLETLIPTIGPRPLDLLKMKGKERQRASSKKRVKQTGKPWSWSDEE